MSLTTINWLHLNFIFSIQFYCNHQNTRHFVANPNYDYAKNALQLRDYNLI